MSKELTKVEPKPVVAKTPPQHRTKKPKSPNRQKRAQIHGSYKAPLQKVIVGTLIGPGRSSSGSLANFTAMRPGLVASKQPTEKLTERIHAKSGSFGSILARDCQGKVLD